MIISRVRQDTGAVPLFTASLDQFRITIPRRSPVTPEFLAWAERHLPGRLSAPQLATVAIARSGHDVDLALLQRLAPDITDARAELEDLVENGILRSRKARDDGPYRITPQLKEAPDVTTPDLAAPLEDLTAMVLSRLTEVPSASREELQEALAVSRSKMTRLLQDLIDRGLVATTGPPTSPNRRYQLARPAGG